MIEKGKLINQKVTILDNTVKEGQVNVVLRTQANEASGILKLVEGMDEYVTILSENIIANYVYISENLEIDNVKFKVEVTEEKSENINMENIIRLQNEVKLDEGIKIVTNEDGMVELDGRSRQKSYIKITNGINVTINENESLEVINKDPVILKKGERIHLDVQEISGKCTTTNINQEFNVVLKYLNGEMAIKCKIKNDVFSQEVILQDNITAIYLYASENVIFDKYTIKLTIYLPKQKENSSSI